MEALMNVSYQALSDENSETFLIKKAINGDAESFTELMKIYKTYLYKIAFSYVKDEQKALDILQECVYRALLNIEKLKKPKFFKTWITKILINVSINYIQKESKIVYLENGVPEKPQHSSLHIEDKLDLYDAIDCLREDYKTVIVLKYFNDLSINDISSIMELPINTVKSHLKRAKDELRQILKEGELNE